MLVGSFYHSHKDRGKKFIVQHFEAMGLKKRRVYTIIKNIEERGYMLRKTGSGGHNRKMTPLKCMKLAKKIVNKTGCSQRKLARTFEVAQSTINNTIKNLKISYFKREKVAKSTKLQNMKQKRRCSILRRTVFQARSRKDVIMDDESYFSLSGEIKPGNSGFYSDNKSNTPDNIRYVGVKKFPTKVMVWAAISRKGVSRVVAIRRKSINRNSYLAILKKNLPEFIQKNHSSSQNVVFWPDLATSHYVPAVREWLNASNIEFVAKNNNPPNAPQLCPIEHFWSLLKQRVYENDWKAESLIRRISEKAKTISITECQRLFEGLHSKYRFDADNGLKTVI